MGRRIAELPGPSWSGTRCARRGWNCARVGLVICCLLAVVVAAEQTWARDSDIERAQITGVTKADPFVARGSYSLTVRHGDLVARWRGTVRRTTRLDFRIYPTTKRGGVLPGFHGEGPSKGVRRLARKGRHRTVTAVFKHPKVVRGWPCVQGNVIDEPVSQPRVWPLGPFTYRLLCPRGGLVN
jgi:hypothetical protein